MPMPSAPTDHDQRGTARARSTLTCCAASRETVSRVARSRVPREHRLILGGRSWYVTPRPRAEGERPLVGATPLHGASTDQNQRGTARARSELAYCAASRETVARMARSRVPREHRLILGGRSWYVAPRRRTEGERPLAGVMLLPSASTDYNQRGTARARSKLAYCASSRDSERSGVLACAMRTPADSGRPQLVRRTTAARRRREAS